MVNCWISWLSESYSQSGCDLHSHQLLEEELASVGDVYSANVLGGLADGALELLFSQIGLANEPTLLTDMHTVAVTDFKEPLLQEP